VVEIALVLRSSQAEGGEERAGLKGFALDP
jgi:hypothetical protein